MAVRENVTAQYKVYDDDGNVVHNSEDKPVKESVNANFAMPENLEEAVVMWGENAVFYHARSGAKVQAQQALRSNKEKSQNELQQIADKWKPTQGKPRGQGRDQKMLKLLSGMSQEEREQKISELLAKLQSGDAFDDDEEDDD